MNTADDAAPTRAQQLIGDFSPKLVSLTDDLLFGRRSSSTSRSTPGWPRAMSAVQLAKKVFES